MHKNIVATAAVLIAFVLSGTAVSALPMKDLQMTDTTVPTGGIGGQAIGCDMTKEGYVYGYGKAGVPSSSGYPDDTCDYNSYEHSGAIAYTVLKGSTGRSYTSAYGGSFFTGYARIAVSCADPADLLVDWTGDEPEITYLNGGDCSATKTGEQEFEEVDWYTYGNGYDTVKFVHTDNQIDALLHLLA